MSKFNLEDFSSHDSISSLAVNAEGVLRAPLQHWSFLEILGPLYQSAAFWDHIIVASTTINLIVLDRNALPGVELFDDLVDELQEHWAQWSDYLWL